MNFAKNTAIAGLRVELCHVKHAILARVVSLKKHCCNSIVVRLESDELNGAATIVSTGLACERIYARSPDSALDVTCMGDPRAEIGDTVPVVVESG